MRILHILRSKPDQRVRALVDGMSRGEDSAEVALYAGPVDYDRLVAQIFESDRVISWWAERPAAAEQAAAACG